MRTSCVVVCALLASCGNLNNLSLASGPLVTVHAHVDLASIAARANGAPLLGAVVWGVLPNVAPICFEEKGDAVVDADCPDPFGFFPGAADTIVTLDPNGTGDFDIPLIHLPPGGALIGADAADQIAYATVLVVADTNQDGLINLLSGGPANGGFAGDEMFGDVALAASFVSLRETQERLTFRQGSFTGLNLYYPAPACMAPPAGYSVLETGPFSNSSATCDFVGLEKTIEAAVLSSADSAALACRTRPISKRVTQPKANSPMMSEFGDGGVVTPDDDGGTTTLPSGATIHCVGSNIMLVAIPGDCPSFATYALKGCRTDPGCSMPTWDETATPPSWWPCGP